MTEVKIKANAKPEPVGTNWTKLPFPTDPQGTVKALRDGGITSARRIRGDKEKYDRYMQSIRILAQFATEVYEQEAEKINALYKGAE